MYAGATKYTASGRDIHKLEWDHKRILKWGGSRQTSLTPDKGLNRLQTVLMTAVRTRHNRRLRQTSDMF